MSSFSLTKGTYSFLIILLINIKFSNHQNKTFNISMNYSNGLDYLHINNNNDNDKCKKWVFSLFSPILLNSDRSSGGHPVSEKVEGIDVPPFSFGKKIQIRIYDTYNFEFLDKYNLLLGIDQKGSNIPGCYFGLSSKVGNFTILNNTTDISINKLYKDKKIEDKVFSFDKWFINPGSKEINTSFYFGFEHDNFKIKNKNATLGKCRVEKDYDYWGCSFDQMSLNENIVDLKDKDNNTYKIYFSTENYNITFPESFSDAFFYLTNEQCKNNSDISEDIESYVGCINLLDKKNNIPIKLISKDMSITIEIDSQSRFNDNRPSDKTYIRYEKVDYFILPLIMFKNFHIQFDAKNDTIKFYTEEKDILEVPDDEEEEEEDKKPNNNSSKVGVVFLTIFIIILIIALSYGIFWLIRKRKGSVEKNINKYNKFDEDDNYQNLSEQNKVF